MSIAIFYSLGTGVGGTQRRPNAALFASRGHVGLTLRALRAGLVGPTLFGSLVSSKDRWHLFYGYLLGAGLMMIAAIVVLFLGVNAEVPGVLSSCVVRVCRVQFCIANVRAGQGDQSDPRHERSLCAASDFDAPPSAVVARRANHSRKWRRR